MGIISLLRGRDFLSTLILSISVRRNGNVHGYFRRYLSTGANKKGLALMTSPLEGKLIWTFEYCYLPVQFLLPFLG